MTPLPDSPRRSRATGRGIAAAVLTSAALLLVSACGSAQTDEPAEPAAGDGTRTVQSARGPVEIPETPQRIVAVDYISPEILFDLEAPLVGALDLSSGADGEKYSTITAVGNDSGELNFEQLAGLDPDVIIGNEIENEAAYDQLAQIAPTVLFSDGGTDWKATVNTVAEIAGKTADVQSREQAYQTEVERLRGEFGDAIGASGAWAVAGTYDGASWYVYGSDTGPNTVLTDLGATLAPVAEEVRADPNTFTRTLEQLDALQSAQVILFDDLGPPVTTEGAAATLQADPLFSGLPAAQAGKVYPGTYNVVTYGQAESVLQQLAQILPQL
ncbi:hypothetical protein GCM10009613_38320 [Pseudonocardia kongjuensis]|uniref:Fe/B12 periplasmic-binding domain-containing protein n=1 Tax=Pseudonocardia kongjuensis TaxID=102227 RepID=A0ABN1XY05_9PSEU